MSKAGGASTRLAPLTRGPLGAAILTACLVVLTLLGFHRWMPRVWFGDDLANYEGFVRGLFASSLRQSLTQSVAEKYRPVYALAMEGMFTAFGVKLQLYLYVNVLLNAVNGLLTAVIAFRLSRSRLTAALAAVMVVLSRFMLFQVTQVTGLLEGVGFWLLLVNLWAIVDLHLSEHQDHGVVLRRALLVVISAWLLIFNHERYMLAIPWMAAMLWTAPSFRRLSSDERQAVVAGVLGSAVVNLGYKRFVLEDAILVGTGGTRIAFDPAGVIDRTRQGVVSVFGFNDGPLPLVGHSVFSHPFTPVGAVAMAFIALLVVLAVMALLSREARARPAGRWPILLPASFAVLAGLLLAPATLTIRLEQRWLVEPFALVVLSASWCVGRIASRPLGGAVFAALALASIIVDTRLKAAFPDIYMVFGEREAVNIKRATLDKEPRPSRVVVVGPAEVCDWILQHGDFFTFYAPGVTSQCVTGPELLPPHLYQEPDRPRILAVQQDQTVTDETSRVYKFQVRQDEPKRYDLLQMFPSGVIDNPAPQATPSGKGALVFPVRTISGAEQSLVVLDGFAYRYENLAVAPGDKLKFDVGMVYATPSLGRARVFVKPANGPAVLAYQATLPTRTADKSAVLSEVSVPLDGYAGPITISFVADSPGYNPAGIWIAFGAPRITTDGSKR